MRTLIMIATAASLGLGACGQSNGAEPAGPTVQRDYQVAAFDKIEVAGPFDVTVTTGGKPSVHASGPSNLLEKMEVIVEGGVLKIRPEKRNKMFGWNFGSGKATVAVTVPMLSEAAIAGSGGIAIDKISGARFKGGIAGSGDLRLAAVDAGDVELSIAGSGGVTAAGKAKSVTYEIAGSGDIDAKGLVAETARVSIAGSGNVNANATGSANIEMVGSGNVDVTGGAKCTTDKAGSGEVTCS